MNTQLIDSIIQVIRSLSPEEQAILEEKLFFDFAYPSTPDIITLALQCGSFDFLNDEPDLYSLDDGEPIPCL
ncbi:hypothetical protein BST81_10565 [Leptolyngbya sp. 'hensonii']|uniref:hypothetical protein n=1 Tax=Leptolyngbya sp. 'hensonii' TaxID=1922337 RepID=UPI00095031CE|nr:hypothetical protein [Leptolyngbya sp. 'hensonii']OLP18513.1 hypothetical protein BST81_10565 [Leptolyngbya sp. 'hensonii']